MKCPECVKNGDRSTVYPKGGSTTCLGYAPYYDEDGNYHNHDPNHTNYSYECSNGHEWHEKVYRSCSSCDWTGP